MPLVEIQTIQTETTDKIHPIKIKYIYVVNLIAIPGSNYFPNVFLVKVIYFKG